MGQPGGQLSLGTSFCCTSLQGQSPPFPNAPRGFSSPTHAVTGAGHRAEIQPHCGSSPRFWTCVSGEVVEDGAGPCRDRRGIQEGFLGEVCQMW